MARAIAARIQGDDYQARWFWVQVCRLFAERTRVVRVAYEESNVKSFDDVVTYFGNNASEDEDNLLQAEYYQVKFHVTSAGSITWQGLMDPSFINATSVSILQRLKNAQEQYAPSGTEAHIILYSPWQIHPEDLLAQVHSQTDGRLDWYRLAKGGEKSQLGKLRSAWRKHLGIETDEQLRVVLCPLRIHQGPTLNELGNKLNDKLYRAGLKPVDEGCQCHPYDDLARKFIQTGRTQFTRSEIEVICKREKLWMGYSIPEPDTYRVGIRSFLQWAENLEDETDVMLDLLHWFNGRYIKSPELWQKQIYPEIKSFLSTNLRPNQRCLIHFHTHASIVFAAGYCLNSKSGVDVAVVQSTTSGREIWRLSAKPKHEYYPTWHFAEKLISDEGVDIALTISATHDVLSDVEDYITQSKLIFHRIISCSLCAGASQQAVLNADHAKLLATHLSNHLKSARTTAERKAKLHIFAAAPNALVFSVGQLAQSFGSCVFYEYDFDRSNPGEYQPTLSFPFPILHEH
ncbi:SAVED domain-containing protein [Synechocystis sp. PCC 7509]|uniref:SAVED domain-containing protein n=1 Tax=Synechocystis sp. PCC 7509 TaxID=927677 RepID=UPI0002ACD636|nr:SAVED domain-containing protein [Synechocystis sp. PCC 7509]